MDLGSQIRWDWELSDQVFGWLFEHWSIDHVDNWVNDAVNKLADDNVVGESLVQARVVTTDADQCHHPQWNIGHRDTQ